MTISAFRTIAIGAVPSMYGVAMPPPEWPMADPEDVLDYSVDWSAMMADVNDVVVSASLSISPWGSGELAASNLSLRDTVMTVWLTSGIAGRIYTLRCEAVTRDGRTFAQLVRLQIDPTLALCPPPPPPNLGFSTPLMASRGTALDFRNGWNLIYLAAGVA